MISPEQPVEEGAGAGGGSLYFSWGCLGLAQLDSSLEEYPQRSLHPSKDHHEQAYRYHVMPKWSHLPPHWDQWWPPPSSLALRGGTP